MLRPGALLRDVHRATVQHVRSNGYPRYSRGRHRAIMTEDLVEVTPDATRSLHTLPRTLEVVG